MNKLKRTKGKIQKIILMTTMAVMMCAGEVLASSSKTSTTSAEDILAPLTNLKVLVLAAIGTAGVIVFAKNVMEFATAYQQQDTHTMGMAIKGIIGGAIMAAISSVMVFLGIS